MVDDTKKMRSATVAGFATTALLVAATMFSPAIRTAKADPGDVCTATDQAECDQSCQALGWGSRGVCWYNSQNVATCECVC